MAAHCFIWCLLVPLTSARLYDISGIRGWYEAGETVHFMLHTLSADNKLNAVAEIGIHHGKSFISMLDAIPVGVPIVAFDLFEGLQTFNYDKSGKGNQTIFTQHLNKFFAQNPRKKVQVHIHSADSTKMTPEDVFNATSGNKVSFFSIDGCHTTLCTLSDLRLAYAVLDESGIIMVDDYFNLDWPGASAGVVIFLEEKKVDVSVLMYDARKIYIVRRKDKEKWLHRMSSWLKSKPNTNFVVRYSAFVNGDDVIHLK